MSPRENTERAAGATAGTGKTAWSRWPWSTADHGPLPVLLLMLSVITGLVDAVSYLALGHVFVANMTGNIVLLGFALAGAPGLSVPASLAALAAFLLGAVAGGRIGTLLGGHRGLHLRAAATCAAPLLLIACLVAVLAGQPVSSSARYALLVPMGLAMGLQNATARRLAVPDITIPSSHSPSPASRPTRASRAVAEDLWPVACSRSRRSSSARSSARCSSSTSTSTSRSPSPPS